MGSSSDDGRLSIGSWPAAKPAAAAPKTAVSADMDGNADAATAAAPYWPHAANAGRGNGRRHGNAAGCKGATLGRVNARGNGQANAWGQGLALETRARREPKRGEKAQQTAMAGATGSATCRGRHGVQVQVYNQQLAE